jgi:predicted secreted protein
MQTQTRRSRHTGWIVALAVIAALVGLALFAVTHLESKGIDDIPRPTNTTAGAPISIPPQYTTTTKP